MDALFGGQDHFDAANGKIGYTIEGLLGESHYDKQGRKVGYSVDDLFGKETELLENDEDCDDDW